MVINRAEPSHNAWSQPLRAKHRGKCPFPVKIAGRGALAPLRRAVLAGRLLGQWPAAR